MLKKFKDGSFLKFGRGNFDDWCIHYVKSNGKTSFPLDSDYFQCLRRIGEVYGFDSIYHDFLVIYNRTTKEIDNNVFNLITILSLRYGRFCLMFDVVMSIIYMGMIAEENKKNTVLGKRIKRLGVYLVLVKHQSIDYAANFMRGMKWRKIDGICKEYGF